jgi:hypothetical protein
VVGHTTNVAPVDLDPTLDGPFVSVPRTKTFLEHLQQINYSSVIFYIFSLSLSLVIFFIFLVVTVVAADYSINRVE